MLNQLESCVDHLGYATMALAKIVADAGETHPAYVETLTSLINSIDTLADAVQTLRDNV